MEKKIEIVEYYCDFPGCREKSWLGKGFDWKMCEIVFGIHPQVLEELAKKYIKVPFRQRKFHFCRTHHFMKDQLLYFIAGKFPDRIGDHICTKADLKEGLGCWITIHDCLSPGEAIRNYQFDYETFLHIFQTFYLSSLDRSSLKNRVSVLHGLRCETRF